MKNLSISQQVSLSIQPIFPSSISDDTIVAIFLHEALGSIGQWKSFPQQLCNELGVNGIVYERQGYGESSPLTSVRDESYLHDYALKELPEVINNLISPDKKIILVGHSDGGSIALLYANYFPKQIIGIISMAAHVIVEDITLKGIAPAIQAFEQGKLKGLEKYHGDKTESIFYAWASTWNLPNFRNWNITAELTEIKAPILLIQGVDDQYGTVKQIDLIIENTNCEATKLMIPNCGHHPHLEQLEKVILASVKWSKSAIFK